MAWHNRLQQLMSGTGVLVVALLLARFALDFSASVAWWLAVPFWLLAAAAISASVVNLLAAVRGESARPASQKTRGLLLAAIPVAMFAASLDCSGLALSGCSRFCSFIKLVWIPLIAVGCAAHFLTRLNSLLGVLTLMSFLPLAPHCVCYNVANAWWIDRIGASPECYVWGFAVSMVSLTALSRVVRPWVSIGVSWSIIGGAAGFFIGHHYFQFPW
ncbi:MAG TPA: hypothetical protein VJH03_15620 [Blastocatellia bacterium]|nr:hypothetical protein [Blastocatellia bacterium]